MANPNNADETAESDASQPTKKTLTAKDLKKHPLRTTYTFASDVKKHKETQYSQNFATYTDIYGAEDLDYDLIDGLYHSTILNRVIKKIASDAVPEMFKLQVVDLEGNRIPEIEEACFMYTANLKRKHIKAQYIEVWNWILIYRKQRGRPIGQYVPAPPKRP